MLTLFALLSLLHRLQDGGGVGAGIEMLQRPTWAARVITDRVDDKIISDRSSFDPPISLETLHRRDWKIQEFS